MAEKCRGIMRLSSSPAGKKKENRDAGEDDEATQSGVHQIVGKRVIEPDSGDQYEQRRDPGVSPDAVGAACCGVAPAEDKQGAGSQHVKKPFRENGEGKKLAVAASQKQQHDGETSLRDYGGGRAVKARVNLGECGE